MSFVASNRDWNNLKDPFKRKLLAIFDDIAGHGLMLFLLEGWRSKERQAWLYAQGRTRPGPIVTYKDGVQKTSYHQSGFAGDVIWVNEDGSHFWPPLFDAENPDEYSPEWRLLQSSVQSHECRWGGEWLRLRDTPHIEWRS